MARFVLRGSISRYILICAVFALGFALLQAPVALAQHGGGGHAGGGGHFGGGSLNGGGHRSAPPASARQTSHGSFWHPRGPVGPPPAGAGTRNSHFHQQPVFIFRHPFFGPRFYSGSNYGWPYCSPYYWGWGFFNCYSWPYYGYGFGSYAPYYTPWSPGAPPTYEYPAYPYRGESHDLPQLYLKDGTVYDVSDYWLVDGQLHFTIREEGRTVERIISFDELDLQTTIDMAMQRGFRFVLRNEPLEQYLRDHPEGAPPAEPPQN